MATPFENDLKKERLEQLLQLAIGALADIAYSEGMSLEQAKQKAMRVHGEISSEVDGKGE